MKVTRVVWNSNNGSALQNLINGLMPQKAIAGVRPAPLESKGFIVSNSNAGHLPGGRSIGGGMSPAEKEYVQKLREYIRNNPDNPYPTPEQVNGVKEGLSDTLIDGVTGAIGRAFEWVSELF